MQPNNRELQTTTALHSLLRTYMRDPSSVSGITSRDTPVEVHHAYSVGTRKQTTQLINVNIHVSYRVPTGLEHRGTPTRHVGLQPLANNYSWMHSSSTCHHPPRGSCYLFHRSKGRYNSSPALYYVRYTYRGKVNNTKHVTEAIPERTTHEIRI